MQNRVSEFVEELVTPGGAYIRAFLDLTEHPPPEEELAPALLDIMPRASFRGVIDGATLALCLSASPGYRRVVEWALDSGSIPEEDRHLVYYKGGNEIGDDGLAWWFDTLDSRRDGETEMHNLVLLIANRADVLCRTRRDRIVALLADTDRGAGRFTLDAIAHVLLSIGPCQPLERRWSSWVREGLIDGEEMFGPDRATAPGLHVAYLEHCVQSGLFPQDWFLIEETMNHWRSMLDDPELRTIALRSVRSALADGKTMLGRLPGPFRPYLGPEDDAASTAKLSS